MGFQKMYVYENPKYGAPGSIGTSRSNSISCVPKIVSKYDQEISQSQTADNPMAPRGRAAQPSRDIRKTNVAKQPALSSPSR